MNISYPSGSVNAKICIVTETLHNYSQQKLLETLLTGANINNQDYYLTSVFKSYDLSKDKLRFAQSYKTLNYELSQNNHNVIVPLGNIALNALTEFKSIYKYRGSILKSTKLEKEVKIIPTLHPAAIIRQYESICYTMIDFQRIKKESEFSDFRSLVNRELVINPTFDEIIEELDRLYYKPLSQYLSLDIETDMGAIYIKCVGLTDVTTRGFCIPFVVKTKILWTSYQEKYIWEKIRKLLTSPKHYKIIQNDAFEYEQLYPWIGEISPIYMDTMLGHKLCYPEMKKSLDIIASIYTTEPYWKDDAKNANWESSILFKYNCKDITVTLESALNIDQELKDLGLYEFFHGYIMPLRRILNRAYQTGIKVDPEILKNHFETQVNDYDKYQKILDTYYKDHLTKYIENIDPILKCSYKPEQGLNVNSKPQTNHFLYKVLGMRALKTGNKGSTGDEKALTKLAARNLKYKNEIDLILIIRGIRILLSTFLAGRFEAKTKIWTQDINLLIDPDGQIRPNHLIGITVTGRLSASKNIYKRGCNIQNQPTLIRDMYITPVGFSWVIGDESQVEVRLVGDLAPIPELRKIFKSGQDIHNLAASWSIGITVNEITKEQRTRYKKVVHGADYDIGYLEYAYQTKVSNSQGKIALENIHIKFPEIRSIYHKNIQKQLAENRTLVSPFGRFRNFFDRWGDQLFKKAYANIPQGMAADILNMALVRLSFRLPEDSQILLQVHDEGGIQARDEDVENVAKMFKEEVEIPVPIIPDDPIVIPLDVGIGKNWKEAKK